MSVATRWVLVATSALCCAGCGTSGPLTPGWAIVARSSAGAGAGPVDPRGVRQTARAVAEAYLRLEVDRGTRSDRELIAARCSREVAAQLSARPRAPLGGFPPRARLIELRVLPVLRTGHWVAQARIRRAGRPAFLELQLVSSARGPLVVLFTSTAGAA